MYCQFKRVFDCIAALVLFTVLSPFFLLLCCLVRVRLGKPVFFVQKRTTLGGREYCIFKFRTMTEQCDANGNYLPDEMRLTRWGRVMRATSLDELPELLNIIKGDMAVIGPRPMPSKYNRFYTKREQKRFNVRGGLIPPEVVYNNVEPTWNEQLEYEANYAESVSAKLDLQILYAVFKGLFTRYKEDYGQYIRRGLDEERSAEEDISR